jgi:hypothetical protein
MMLALLLLFVSLPTIEQEVFARVNAERTSHGLPPLLAEQGLQIAARAQNDDMTRRNFFAHVNPEGEGPSDRVSWRHRQLIGEAGENLWLGSGDAHFYPSAAEIVASWMKSPGHRENILRREFTHMGIAVALDRGTARATLVFATVAGYASAPIPTKVSQGARLRLDVKDAVLFDLWSAAQRQAVLGPLPLEQAAMNAPPGFYILRFYFPKGDNRFAIHQGPSIEIR